jgi:serine/threonine protein kinase/Flp pilus assembly protein TadD
MIGKTISHYKILKKLGEGGMGVVYKAQDTKLKRPVALKFLHASSIKDKSKKSRLLQEAQAAAAVNHPNVCTIYEIDEADGHVFIAMEYVEGKTLKDLIPLIPPLKKGDDKSSPFDKGRVREGLSLNSGIYDHVLLPMDTIIDYAIEIAKGLQAIQEKGMVHRDIKSENILITDKDQVKIMDFGLVKPVHVKDKLTNQDSSGGTIAYMSPEQIRGEAIDHRSDIWSFGVVLYEMLTGQLPFIGENAYAVVDSILNEKSESMIQLRMDIPNDLKNIIDKALTKDPDDRHRNVQEILIDLKQCQKSIESKPIKEKPAPEKIKPSIAVLPFTNMSTDPEQEYFCDGITEEIINALTHIGSLYVVARTSAFFFKGKNIKLRDIGKELNVETILEGSCRKSGNRLRITAQLINVENDYHIWSEKYDREMEDVFEIQDEISLAIAEALKIRLLKKEKAAVVKRHTEDHQAYELYLKGNYFWNQRSEEGYHKAIGFFQKAIEKDPKYARAYAGIGKSYFALSLYFMDPNVAIPKAQKAARKALEIDNTIGEVYGLLGITHIYHYHWEEAEKYCQRAVTLGPQDTYSYHVYGDILNIMQKHDEAIRVLEQALELDPLSLNMNSVFGYTLLYAHRYDDAIKQFLKVLEMDPDFQHTLMYLGITYIAKNMIEDAINTLRKFYSLSVGSPIATALLGFGYARAGRKKQALQMLEQLDKLAKEKHVLSLHRALIYMGLGDYDQTFEYLEKTYAKHEPLFPVLNIGPLFNPIRLDPRYKTLMKKMHLEKWY